VSRTEASGVAAFQGGGLREGIFMLLGATWLSMMNWTRLEPALTLPV